MADPQSQTGARYADPEILRYVDSVHARHDPALDAAYDAPRTEGLPPISLARSEGKVLEVLMRLGRVKKAVEIGTLAGYSAIRIARALPPDGMLWTVEANAKHAEIARARIENAGLSERVRVVEGSAMTHLETLRGEGPFDAVFIDADKENYDSYARWATTNLREGGLVVGDNAYFFGELLGDSAGARAMRQFHEIIATAFDSACIPTPDGLVVGVKR